jgi:hypothetical protein
MLIVAVSLPPLPSEIVYVNESEPKKFAFGVYVTVLPLVVTVPLDADPTPVIVSGLPSGSVSFVRGLNVMGVSSGVVRESFTASGPSFTEFTVTVTVAVEQSGVGAVESQI